MWKINTTTGITWNCPSRMSLPEALEFFYKVTGFEEKDIKEIVRTN